MMLIRALKNEWVQQILWIAGSNKNRLGE